MPTLSFSRPLPVLHRSNDPHRLKPVDLEDIEAFGHMLQVIIDPYAKRLLAWILMVKGRLLERSFWGYMEEYSGRLSYGLPVPYA